jgi:hypothetical protein
VADTGRNAACTDELRESESWDWGVEIGFTLGRETQGKGYAQEGASSSDRFPVSAFRGELCIEQIFELKREA